MGWVIFTCVKIFLTIILFTLTGTTNAEAWSVTKTPEYHASEIKTINTSPCSGTYSNISVNNEIALNACVMGEKTRVASFYLPQKGVAYAISFPFDTTFYRLDVCSGVWRCEFAEKTDTFISFETGYVNFVKNLTRTIHEGVIRYQPGEASATFSVNQLQGKYISPMSLAVSGNGEWLLIEARDYGIFRINTLTTETRRIIAPGINYGYGTDPRVEMAVSNDGSMVAVMGLRMGIDLVQVDDTCGDRPRVSMGEYYLGSDQCQYVPIDRFTYVSQFMHALRPRFSTNSTSLSFNVHSYTQPVRHITLFSDVDAKQSYSYVALGDSYTSGEGETEDTFYIGSAANKCHVSSRSYPYLLTSMWKTTGHSLACSGATMNSARGTSSNTKQTTQLLHLESIFPQISTIGIGGNDAGLIGKLKDCLGLDTCKWAGTAENRKSTAMEIKNLYPRLKAFYEEVKLRTLKAVLAIGYPTIISSQAQCNSPVGLLLNETERIFMNEAMYYLNKVIKAAAYDTGIRYVDTENSYVGKELCSGFSSAYMNDIRFGDDYPNIGALPFIKVIGAESFHPKPEGHVRIADTIYQIFPNFLDIEHCLNCSASIDAPTPSSYWGSVDGEHKLQVAEPFLDKTTVLKGDMFTISMPKSSFKPSSDVVLELHSDVKILGVVRSADDGSLQATIPTSDLEAGFHSVHAIGQNFAGYEIDIYDFLSIEEDVVFHSWNANKGSTQTPVLSAAHTESKEVASNILGATTTADKSAVILMQEIKPFSKKPQASALLLYLWALCAMLLAVIVLISLLVYVLLKRKHARKVDG
jgi:lysophospholipase L1-like esterase